MATIRDFPSPALKRTDDPKPYVYPPRTWYEDVEQQLFCRPSPEAANDQSLYGAFKGGRNDAGHNHNDIGVYGVAIGGREVAGDPGNKAYDLDTFGPKRYNSNLRNSYGHPVPVVDGKLQSAGPVSARLVAKSFTPERDAVKLDLKDAYDVPKLRKLERSFGYDRANERIIVRDEVAFDGTGTFETPIVTFGTVEKLGESLFRVTGKNGKDKLLCRVKAKGGEIVTREEMLEDPGNGYGIPRRYAIAFKEPVATATLELTWEKEPPHDDLRQHSMVTVDGRRLVSWRDGTNVVWELVATNALPASPGVRDWRIYVVKSTHTDIGLHNSPYIQRHGAVKRIEQAMRLVDADARPDDDPAAYRYVMEGMWFWENYPMDRGEVAAWNVISNYVRRGRIDIACGCAGNHTHVMGPEELRRSALTKRRLLDTWGVATHTMIMADNPGLSWSIVKPYAESGVQNVIFAPNQWNPIPSTLRKKDRTVPAANWNPDARGGGNYIDVCYDSDRPMLFRWESPDRTTNLLVWCSTAYAHGLERIGVTKNGGDQKTVEKLMPSFLERLEKKYPYDLWLACDYADDEEANTAFADFAAEWNAKWASPKFVTVGRLDEPFDEVRRKFGGDIPTVRGEMTSGWLQHVAATPELLSEKLDAERRIAVAEKAWRDDPAHDPHLGWEIDRAWWYLILNDEHSYGTSGYQGRRVFETWIQHRDWIRRARETADRIATRYGLSAPKEGSRTLLAPGVTENRFYRVTLNAKGEIESIFDKELGRELLNGTANRFLYTRDNHKTWSDESTLGAEIGRKVYLADDTKRIDIEDTFEHARDLFNAKRYYRYGYLAFPFDVPNGTFKAVLGGGEVIDPYRDQSGYATDAYVAVRDWCAVENGDIGIALREEDTMLTEFGEIHPDKTCYTGEPPSGKTAIYPYLFTDWLQLHHPDGESMNFRFRFSIVSYRSGQTPWQAKAEPYELAADNFAAPRQDDWTGLLERPSVSHGEKDGQLYVLWGADLSPDFSHYEVYRNGAFVTNVWNEAPDGVPYRVARYEDTGLGSHTNYTYQIRKVMKDGTKGSLTEPVEGLTREPSDAEVLEVEGVRCEMTRAGGIVTSWLPEGCGEVLFRPARANWGAEEVHGGIPICWPWFGKPPRDGLPKHGLARYAKWTLEEKARKGGLRWSLHETPETMRLWPHKFRLDYAVSAHGPKLYLELKATNTDKEPYEVGGGFHPYFKVADAQRVAVNGREITQETVLESEAADGKDRVIEDLSDGHSVALTAEGNREWLLWNPGRERTPLCVTLGSDEWKGFFSVEPCTREPHVLHPGESEVLTLKLVARPPRCFSDETQVGSSQ